MTDLPSDSIPPEDAVAPSDGVAGVDLADTEFEQLFEAVNDAILLVDTDEDRITWANSRACELLGYSREELRSLDPKAIHPHEYDAFRSSRSSPRSVIREPAGRAISPVTPAAAT